MKQYKLKQRYGTKKHSLSLMALLSLSMLATSAALAASPNVQGGSSNEDLVQPWSSTIVPGPGPNGNAGLRFWNDTAGAYSGSADLLQAPIQQAINGVDLNNDGNYWANLPQAPFPVVAQVWQDTDNKVANVYTLRQVMTPSHPMPDFGALVIGQVKDIKGTGDGFPLEQGVYFGEWSPKNGTVGYPTGSTELNMDSDDRVVWYVGDNAVTDTPDLVNVEYKVVGINQTGRDENGVLLAGGLPDDVKLYKGKLTANYDAMSGGDITGSLSRPGSSTINFAGTDIYNDGTFNNGSDIEGRFYNGAHELAGIYTGGNVEDHVAFGGSKVSGTITP